MNESFFFSKEQEMTSGALPKVVLARCYMPEKSTRVALRTLNKWINCHQVLSGELVNAGYTPRCRLLTPEQVRLIVFYLGEP